MLQRKRAIPGDSYPVSAGAASKATGCARLRSSCAILDFRVSFSFLAASLASRPSLGPLQNPTRRGSFHPVVSPPAHIRPVAGARLA